MKKIVSSQKIVKLISESSANTLPDKSLLYQYVFPYPRVIDRIEDEHTFITSRISVPKVRNKTFKELTLYIYVFTHQNLIRTPEGLRTDLIAEEIEKLFNGSLDFGLGHVELESIDDFSPANRYIGLVMQYSVSDFNR